MTGGAFDAWRDGCGAEIHESQESTAVVPAGRNVHERSRSIYDRLRSEPLLLGAWLLLVADGGDDFGGRLLDSVERVRERGLVAVV